MKSNKRVTIHDVARDCGIALSTVSNALADKPHVSAATRLMVRESAARLGYRVNTVARGLRMRRSFTIGVLIGDIANPAYPDFFRGIEDVAAREKCTVFLCNTDGQPAKQLYEMQGLLDRQVDGIVLVAQHMDLPEMQELLAGGPPYVQVQRRSAAHSADYVGSNNQDGILAAIAHLAGLGHKRIGFIRGPTRSSTATERWEAFRAGIAAQGLDTSPELLRDGDYTMECGFRCGQALLQLATPATAIMASNDVNAVGVLQAAIVLGVEVPRQLSVVGLDDLALAAFGPIDLTTIHLPKRDIGAAAAELLMRRIRGRRDVPPREQIFPTRLVIRGSTGAAPTGGTRRRRAG